MIQPLERNFYPESSRNLATVVARSFAYNKAQIVQITVDCNAENKTCYEFHFNNVFLRITNLRKEQAPNLGLKNAFIRNMNFKLSTTAAAVEVALLLTLPNGFFHAAGFFPAKFGRHWINKAYCILQLVPQQNQRA